MRLRTRSGGRPCVRHRALAPLMSPPVARPGQSRHWGRTVWETAERLVDSAVSVTSPPTGSARVRLHLHLADRAGRRRTGRRDRHHRCCLPHPGPPGPTTSRDSLCPPAARVSDDTKPRHILAGSGAGSGIGSGLIRKTPTGGHALRLGRSGILVIRWAKLDHRRHTPARRARTARTRRQGCGRQRSTNGCAPTTRNPSSAADDPSTPPTRPGQRVGTDLRRLGQLPQR